MQDFPYMNLLINISSIICLSITLIVAFIIYRRDPKSYETKFYVIFFVGLGGLVGFYLFLQHPVLKDASYFFQVLSMSTLIFGISQFYYTIAHEGKLSMRILFLSAIILYLLPVISLIFHPYTIIEEPHGFELIIEPWFMILISIIYMSFGFYAVIKLLLMGLNTADPTLKRHLKFNFLGLIIIGTGSILFFVVIPIFFNIQYLKPVGWFLVTIGVVVMAYSFIKRK